MRGMFEGDLPAGAQVRTLDHLNRGTTRFLTLHDARPLSAQASLQSSSVSVNIDAIFWVAEIDANPRTVRGGAKPALNRVAVRFCFPQYEILGFLHTPPQGDPLARLNQDRGSFVAVTSASILGSDTERAASFVAVNARQVFTAETLSYDDAIEDDSSLLEEAEP
jgi:hypothetical protein